MYRPQHIRAPFSRNNDVDLQNSTRDSLLDNYKLLMVILVVLGHGMEQGSGKLTDTLYLFIYLFHMPAFVMVAGYFTRKLRAVAIADLLFQYVLFQTLYLYFDSKIHGFETHLQYTTPYWIMWFVFCLIFWKFFSATLKHIPARIAVPATVVAALLAGLFPEIDYYLSLSRMIYFLPFFVIGFYMRREHIHFLARLAPWISATVLGFSFITLWFWVHPLRRLLYGSVGYTQLGLSPQVGVSVRLLMMIWAMVLIAATLSLCPKRFGRLTSFGAGTMQAYFLHGFFLVYTATFIPELLTDHPVRQLVFYCGLVVLTLALASPGVRRLTTPLFQPFRWMKTRRT